MTMYRLNSVPANVRALPIIKGGSPNIWDEEWEVGVFYVNGSEGANSNCIRSVNHIKVMPNTIYCLVTGTSSYFRIVHYDINNAVINTYTYANTGNVLYTIPNNCYYIKFCTLADSSPIYGGTYLNDISINYPSNLTSYYPHNQPIVTFNTDLAEKLVSLLVEVKATQSGSGTPSPSNPRTINGFSACDILHYNENLFTSMPTATNDGITTSYDSSTGLISIRNDSRTTNYSYGSQRGIVASGLNPNHTYKFAFYPNVLGVTLSDAASTELNNPFTGYSTVVLRVTSQYDFVNTHPVGDLTTVKLFIFDLTEGYNTTYTINFGQTVYGAILNPLSGKLTITHQIVNYDGSETWNYTSSLNRVYINIPTAKRASTGGLLPIISNILHYSYGNKEDYGAHINDQGNLVVFAPNTITTASDWQTWLQSNPLEVVYELTTPVVLQLSSVEVQAIIGNNNIYADTGDTSLNYWVTIDKYIGA